MASASEIREHAPVVELDGPDVGTLDHVEGDRIKLTKSDPSSGGQRHYIGSDLVGSATGQVQLSRRGAQQVDCGGRIGASPPV